MYPHNLYFKTRYGTVLACYIDLQVNRWSVSTSIYWRITMYV